jgi:hypothetical protein
MPETELRQVLIEIADQAEIVGLFDRVEARVHRRRRRQVLAAVAATAMVLIVTTTLALVFTHSASTGPITHPSPKPHTPTRQATRSVTATYLPPGVRLVHAGPLHSPGHFVGKRPSEGSYAISGRRNANTLPHGATPATVGDLQRHPSTGISIGFSPRSSIGDRRSLRQIVPTLASHQSGYRVRWVSIAGNRAVISIDTREHGAFRIDWLDPDGYHSIIEDRLITPEGLSGVSGNQLLKMARSLYPLTG